MIEVCLALALVGAGWWLGRRSARPKETPRRALPERERLAEEQAAFSLLMGYNAGQAYGLHEE